MALGRRSRRLATIVFLDIVGSTEVAAELGDARWRELLGHFRSIVRADLKRHKGREEDTTGDGFFITFDQPAAALRAAVAIVGDVHEVGLDVRCGLHFGEAEMIEGERGGIAVHIGARVMALAGAAEILMTSTVRDVIVGTEMTLDDAGSHDLKGVPGTWHVWRLGSLDGAPVPGPLDAEEGAAIRQGRQSVASRSRRRRVLLAVAAVAAVAVVGGLFAFVIAAPTPPTILRIDPATNTIVREITDPYRSEHRPNSLWAVNGALWQASTESFQGLVRRDMQTGAVLQTIPVTGDPRAGVFGFGSIWMGGTTDPGSIDRWDAVTGRPLAQVETGLAIASMDVGPTAVWVLGETGQLVKIDPLSNTVVGTYGTSTKEPGAVVALADHVWVCDCKYHRIAEFDPGSNAVVRTLTFGEAGFLIGLTAAEGRKTAWLLDPEAATLTPIDTASGQAGQPIGIGANLHGATVSFGDVWVAAGDKVLRVAGDGPQIVARIAMPKGMSAGAIAADPDTGALWVGDCGCPLD
ncbi:MAG TPA: adenylate/guanylate cyclase domain-containing protein [Candidatus Limnocylindrales bacterium]|nr:adenylate/guanylate cyclase domain-containing protein [Candidatus Limnocylindrales bacterium]